jgi:RNA recognition motif-containing protein
MFLSSTISRKLFVGGLSWETTHDNLQRYFQRYGEVTDCCVMKNNETGRSRGFGFVRAHFLSFKAAEEKEEAKQYFFYLGYFFGSKCCKYRFKK